MKNKLSLTIIFVLSLVFNSLNAQELNDYKYIVIPNKYDFLNTENQYKLNSLTKFLFEKENFIAFFKSDKQPDDLQKNPCLGLSVSVNEKSNLFTIRLEILLTNCNNELIFTSSKGISKLKDFKRGYHEALRKAFISIKPLNYEYDDSLRIKDKNRSAITTKPIVSKINELKKEEQIVKKDIDLSQILYAQKIKNGYQLVDKTPSIKYVIINSGLKNIYHIKNSSGIIYKKNNEWFFEINVANEINTTKLNIKF